MVSVNDLHRGLSSFVFRVKQITQNPLVVIPCGFDPRHRHHERKPLLSNETREVFSCLHGQNCPKYRKIRMKQGLEQQIRLRRPCFCISGAKKEPYF